MGVSTHYLNVPVHDHEGPPPQPVLELKEYSDVPGDRDELIAELEVIQSRHGVEWPKLKAKVDAAQAAVDKLAEPQKALERLQQEAGVFNGTFLGKRQELRRNIQANIPLVLQVAISDMVRTRDSRSSNRAAWDRADRAKNKLEALAFVGGDLTPHIKTILGDLAESDMTAIGG